MSKKGRGSFQQVFHNLLEKFMAFLREMLYMDFKLRKSFKLLLTFTLCQKVAMCAANDKECVDITW